MISFPPVLDWDAPLFVPGPVPGLDVDGVLAGTVVWVGLCVPGIGLPPGAPTVIVACMPACPVARDGAVDRVGLALLQVHLRGVLADRDLQLEARDLGAVEHQRVRAALVVVLDQVDAGGTSKFLAWKCSSGSASTSSVLIAAPVGWT